MLEVKNLQVNYGAVAALHGISLSVKQGAIVTLIGGNGAGKTTTLRAISGLQRAAAGEVVFDGRNITALPAHDIVKLGLAHVPEGRMVFANLTVLENLQMGAYLRSDKAAIAEDLGRVYAMFPILAERQRQDAGTLSGGQQQMCAIGRGLMAAPSLLMIDELSLGLAPRVVEELSETLRAVNKSGVAILLVEQDVMNALELADRAYVVDHGRVTKSGPAMSLANDPAIREAYMGLS